MIVQTKFKTWTFTKKYRNKKVFLIENFDEEVKKNSKTNLFGTVQKT